MSQPLEIERKWLINILPFDLSQYPYFKILQGYLKVGKNGGTRLRQKGSVFYKTEKSGSGLVRVEKEVRISGLEFLKRWSETNRRRLEKVRYEVPLKGFVAEVDVYEGVLAGLITVEVEFQSVEEANSFEPPDWFGREVTEDESYTNANLAINGLPPKEVS